MIEIKVRAQDGRMLWQGKCAANNHTRYQEILEMLYSKHGFGPEIPYPPKRGKKGKKREEVSPQMNEESYPSQDVDFLDMKNQWFG